MSDTGRQLQSARRGQARSTTSGSGFENFDAERVASDLDAAGVEGVRLAGSTSVLVPDPDGVIVQLSSPAERFEGTPPNRDC